MHLIMQPSPAPFPADNVVLVAADGVGIKRKLNNIDLVVQRLEGCPGSNLWSGLIPDTRYLKIKELLALDVNYSLNSDDDLFMPELDEVFNICDKEYHFTEEEKLKLLRNPWLSRFGNRKEHKIP